MTIANKFPNLLIDDAEKTNGISIYLLLSHKELQN